MINFKLVEDPNPLGVEIPEVLTVLLAQDDILNGQRHYGDRSEPNNNSASAADLGSIGLFGAASLQQRSIDDNNDVDYFVINATQPLELTISATPAAATYQQGPQTQACNTGATTNYNTIHNLTIDLLAADGTTVIASSNSTGSGETETLVALAPDAGTYIIRVDTASTTNNIQLYDFQVFAIDAPFIGPSIIADSAAPTQVDPGVRTSFDVTIDPNEDVLVGGSLLVNFRAGSSGGFTTAPLTFNAGNSYTATLPPFDCADGSVEYFISAQGQSAGTTTLPSGGASAPFSAVVGEFVESIADNFETDQGWTVAGSITSPAAGRWERGVPVGASDSRISDAPEDADGSGQCFITGNVQDNSDVDGGDTILVSPVFDGTAAGSTVEYFRWFDNNEGGTAQNAFTETFVIEISNNGGSSWTNLETVGPTGPEVSGGWNFRSFQIDSVIAPSDNMRVRFIAQDIDGTIVEAGVDGFRVAGSSCEDPETCPADLAAPFGSLDFFDVLEYLAQFDASDPSADLAAPFGAFDFFDVLEYLAQFDAGCD